MPEMTEEQRKELEEKIKKMSPEELKEFQKQQCVFCQIIAGRVPAKKVYEDEKCLAVMDIAPAAIGHVLLLPKEHYAIMPQIPEEEIGHLFMVSKHLSQAMLRKLKVEGTNIFVANGLAAGQRAQHFMVHIIPRKEGDGVLAVPERLVEAGTRSKIALLIGNRLNELLGIKKEKVAAGKEKREPPLPEEVKERIIEAEFEEIGEKTVPPPLSPLPQSLLSPPAAKKGKSRKKKEKKAGPSQPSPSAEEETGGEEKVKEETEEKSEEEGVSLNDIAELFK